MKWRFSDSFWGRQHRKWREYTVISNKSYQNMIYSTGDTSTVYMRLILKSPTPILTSNICFILVFCTFVCYVMGKFGVYQSSLVNWAHFIWSIIILLTPPTQSFWLCNIRMVPNCKFYYPFMCFHSCFFIDFTTTFGYLQLPLVVDITPYPNELWN